MRTSSWRGALHSRSSEIGLLIIFALAIFLVEQVRWDTILRNQVSWLVNPLSEAASTGVNFISQPIRLTETMFSSTGQVEELKQQQAVLLAEIVELEKLRKENEQLKQLIGQAGESREQLTIAAPILSYAYPAVGVGHEDGVIEGQLVMINDNLVGIVTKVEEHQSRISLLSDVNSQPILVQTDSGARGLLQGTGNKLIISQVMPDAQLLTGEKVITVGQPGIAAGIFVGLVGEKDQSLTQPTQQAEVEQQVSFYSSPLVTIN